MRKSSLGALVAAGLLAGGLSTGSASAADLGGNCCADLEERIAELEATTARKGNRKVSLTVSGWVGQQVMWWDDGYESNTYVGDLGATLSSHFKFTGQATISPGWYAGYVLHVEARNNNSLGLSQDYGTPGAVADGVHLLQSFWFVKSDQLGKLSVGLQSQASDNTAILVDGSGSLVPANWVAFDYANFTIRNSAGPGNTGVRWIGVGGCVGGGAIGDCNGATQNVVRYDSPTFGGFSVSASWGEDDMWDVAARYAGEHAGFKVAVAAAYNENSTELWLGPTAGDTFQYFQIGGYIEHVPTGVFVYGAYGNAQYDLAAGESETYYVKAGLRERWSALGHTVLYGEYENNKADGLAFVQQPIGGAATSSDFDLWGLGVVQEIDAAAMSVWVSYRHVEYNDNSAINYEDFQYVKAGALINF
ncbi:porin [Hyphomicrobium sulfonivorans]|uniref:porin n=1 Tax=Hyphomicrobium sulfonivorans TaxID=121290 RepID=UPI0015704517|nr:porin [Hyphomicrobium sulfonivorans]MBI1650341.1 porin [Hyphomicrobium sulfonivorans]NSL72295.1 porin [Hyphomicrobium sulfonivorans]